MKKCNPMAFARCPDKRFCKNIEDAEFMEGSDCDEFNQSVMSHAPTNADRIRCMTDEELTVFLDDFSCHCVDCVKECERGKCPIYKEGAYCRPKDIMKWLRQPAEEDNHGNS